jgi:transcriptional regulator with XRE-family HTH domain
MLGMTQLQLAQSVGIRFQQVQKYESGGNRVSASRLWDLARALDVPVQFFYDGLDAEKSEGAGSQETTIAPTLDDRDTHDLVRAYSGLSEGPRRRLLDLAKAISEMTPPSDR